MFPIFIRDFGWTYSELGLLSTLFFVVSGVGQASAGFVVDRLGARPVLFGSMVLFTLACLLASVADSYALLMGVAVLAGLGNAPFHPVDFTILNQRVSTPRLGYAFSVHGLSGNLGWAVAPVFFTVTGALWGWRHAFLAAACVYALVLGVLFWHRAWLKTTVSVRTSGASVGANDLAFLRLPVVWWCFAFFLLSTVTLAVVQNFSVPILKALHGVSLERASMTLTAYMFLGAVGMLAGGFVAARWPRWSDRVYDLRRRAHGFVCQWLVWGYGHLVGIGRDGFGHWCGRSEPRSDDQKSHPQRGHWPGVRSGLFGLGRGLCLVALVVWHLHGPWLVPGHIAGGRLGPAAQCGGGFGGG
jgi:MFS family permease